MERKIHGHADSVYKIKKGSLREKPWMVSTIVLGSLVILLLLGNIFNITGKTVSGQKAGQNLLDFAVSQGLDAELSGVEKNGSFYLVTLNLEGQEDTYYVTKDGKYLIPAIYPLEIEEEIEANTNTNSNTQTTEVPKTQIPVVELFIWGYCPYGVQAQGPLAEVAELLGEYADFRAVMYYGGHGDYEIQQNKIQECIQELYPEKYWGYAAGFAEDIYPVCSSERTVECDTTESISLMKSLGIDSTKVLSCVDSQGEGLITVAFDYAKTLGVTGSPTLIINGVKSNVARNAESYKDAVCNAFTNAPEECGEELDSGATASSGSC